MEIPSDIESLEKITERNEVVLLDTCSLSPCYASTRYRPSAKLQTLENQHQILFLQDVQQLLRSGAPIYVTPHIAQEMFQPKKLDLFERTLRKLPRKKRRFYPSHRSIERVRAETSRLQSVVFDFDHILSLDSEEQEQYASTHHTFRDFPESYSLSCPDYDLLLSGMVLSQTRGPTAILTQDRGIHLAYEEAIARESTSLEDLHLYTSHSTVFPQFFQTSLVTNS